MLPDKQFFSYIFLPLFVLTISCGMLAKEEETEEIDPNVAREETKRQFKYFFIREAGPPRVVEEGLLFTYLGKTESVEVSGDFLGWEYTIPLVKGKYGIFYYLYTAPLSEGQYTYRYRVDGLWINDPFQTNTIFDKNNQRVSCFDIEESRIFYQKNPTNNADGSYTFQYSNASANEVYFTCDYYDYNPTRFPMTKDPYGRWWCTIDIPAEGVFYNYIVEDEWVTDPLNYNIYLDYEGRKHSFVNLR